VAGWTRRRGEGGGECRAIGRQLMDGSAVRFNGAFFDLGQAVVAPAPAVRLRIIVGGRSDTAVRAGRAGWVMAGSYRNLASAFCRRFRAGSGRGGPDGRPSPPSPSCDAGMVGLADSKQTAGLHRPGRRLLPAPVRAVERTARTARPADDVASPHAQYVDCWAYEFNLIPRSHPTKTRPSPRGRGEEAAGRPS